MNVFDKILDQVKRISRGYNMRHIAEDAAERIKRRTRLGYGVKDGRRSGKRERLKETKESYRKARARDKKRGRLSSTTTVKKSNLTRTGQLLASIRGRSSGTAAIIETKGGRDDGRSNSEVAGYVAENGRPFFELTDKELKGLRNTIKKDLIKRLRKR